MAFLQALGRFFIHHSRNPTQIGLETLTRAMVRVPGGFGTELLAAKRIGVTWTRI